MIGPKNFLHKVSLLQTHFVSQNVYEAVLSYSGQWQNVTLKGETVAILSQVCCVLRKPSMHHSRSVDFSLPPMHR